MCAAHFQSFLPQSSSYADPKTYLYSPYEGDDDDDFYEEDEPVPCTFTDTHI